MTLAGEVQQQQQQQSTGQSSVRGKSSHRPRPMGTEIDPAEFLQHSTAQLPSNTRSGQWPSSLALVSPSVTELHAHIASIQSHTDATAPNTSIAQDVSLLKKKKALNKPRSSSSYSRTRIGRTASRFNGRNVVSILDNSDADGDNEPPPAIPNRQASKKQVDGPKWSAINRIEAGNNRLLQQFEELDREIRDLKNKKAPSKGSEKKVVIPSTAASRGRSLSASRASASAGASSGASASVGEKASSAAGAEAKGRSRSHSTERLSMNKKPFQNKNMMGIPTQLQDMMYGDAPLDLDDAYLPPPPPPPGLPSEDDQDTDALEAIKSIFRESVDREKILLQREQSLDVRESLLTSTYYATMEKASVPEVKYTPPVVNDEELKAENENLKAELYELRAAKRRGFQSSKRGNASANDPQKENEECGDDSEDEGGEEEEGEGEEYSSDDDQEEGGDGDGEGKKKKKEKKKKKISRDSSATIKVNRKEYEALVKNYAELEVCFN
jgi:hypothetical protein